MTGDPHHPDVKITRLDSGLRIISQTMPHVDSATIGVWVDTGARWETAAENGLSHMLEHMAFKGTYARSARQIAEEIEAVGGVMNAYTSRENTAYYVQVLREDVPLGLNLLADILQNSLFDPAEISREREVIIQEIGEAQDTPDDLIYDLMQDTAFPDQAMGRPILGNKSQVNGFRQHDLHAFMGKHYTPSRMVLSAAGAVTHDSLVAQAMDLFTKLAPAAPQPLDPMRYCGGETMLNRDLEQVHFMMCLPGVAYEDSDYYPAQVLSTILGGGMSSRLFQEIREERGLAYTVYSFASSYVDGGLFGMYAGTSAHHVPELIRVLCAQLLDLTENISEAELDRAKAQLKASLLMSMESSSARCEQLARQILIFDRTIDKTEMIRKLDAVDPDAVRMMTRRLLSPATPTGATPTIATLGPLKDMGCLDLVQSHLGQLHPGQLHPGQSHPE